MIRIKLFDAVEKPLVVYNAQAMLDYAIDFYTEACDDDFVEDQVDYTFPAYVSSYFRIYNERLGRQIKNIALVQSGSFLIINASALDLTFDTNGNYFYEIGYVQSGGYEIALMYGVLKVV